MADLADFKVVETPRPPEVCKRYVRRVEPLWGFVVYGVLWYFVAFVAFAIGIIPGFAFGNAVGAKGALWVQILGFVGGGIAFVLAWIPYVRWAKRKRARTLPLIRDGVLLEGSVFNNMSGPGLAAAGRVVTDFAVGQLGVKFYRVTVEHNGMPHMLHVPNPGFGERPAPGTTLPVLFHPGVAHALVFDQRGKANVARVR